MRTVFAKILGWCFGTLVFAWISFSFVSYYLALRNFESGGPFRGMLAMQAEQAEEAYQRGGVKQLAAYIDELKRFFSARHYFLDSSGRDVLTGEQRSDLLKSASRPGPPGPFLFPGGPVAISRLSPDGRFVFIGVMPHLTGIRGFLPYYLFILAAITFLCWVLAVSLVSPLKKLALAVRRFGTGDLSVRANSRRKDEIGDLGRAFDDMAERIATLVTAERRLLQDISHELRTPLSRLGFAAELLRTAPDRDAAIARMNKEIERLSTLVGDLLQVTRVEADPLSRNVESFELNAFIDELLDDCAVEAQASSCRVRLNKNGSIHLRADPELVRRAFENIVRNAIRYAPADTDVEVSVSRDGLNACISVRDHGPGVPESELTKIFKPFHRVDESRDHSTGGVGLGLAIARRAIALHHGRVWAENADPGLKVVCEIPLNRACDGVDAEDPQGR
jgi:signal transduction histidine kinase